MISYTPPVVQRGAVRNLTVVGKVTGTGQTGRNVYVGGIAGMVDDCLVANCANLCIVENNGGGSAGGIAGYVKCVEGYQGSLVLISDCYNVGTITGANHVGGIAGRVELFSYISNCYNAGQITGKYTGEITAYADHLLNCYYLSDTDTDPAARTAAEFADGTVRKLLKAGERDNNADPWADECKYLAAADKTLPVFNGQGDAHTHQSNDWKSNETEHWQVCTCGAVFNKAEHSGGKATCIAKAVCEFCKAEYGEKLPHDFTAETVDAKYLKSAATCTEKAVYYKSCAVCGLSSEGTADEATFFSGNALDHDWGAWTQNSDEKTHTRICKRDTSHTETENCYGGTATCTHKAVCTVCDGEYGEMAAHSFTAEKAEAQYLKSAATCTEKAIYYKSCAVCALSSEGTADEETFFSGNALDHNWGAWTSNEDGTHTRTCTVDGCSAGTQTENCIDANKDHKCDICDYIISECADDNKDHKCDYCGKKLTEHTGGKATCTEKAVCEVCGKAYGEFDANNHSDLKHIDAKAATKDAEGNIEYWYCEGCGKYFSDKDGTKEIKKADTITAKLKDDSKLPQTGDISNLALWLALLFISGGAAIGTTIVSRKKKYSK